ncbi:MAG TPA: DUF4432 family protein, partial [Pyrinomonadaceae bacterium]|nr:DUF4432 family protein [Pyrinomonadaceae bacterium]
PTDTDFMWHSPNGLRPLSHFRPSSPLAAGHFREHFAGGWYEMLPNGPGPCMHRGAEFGYHGEATLLPWSYQVKTDESDCVAVKFQVRLMRVPLKVEKTLTLGRDSSTLHMNERITNEAGQTIEFLWGHHPTFGHPFLEEGCRIYVPPCIVRVGDEMPPDSRLAPAQTAAWPTLRGRDGASINLSIVPAPETRSHDFVRLEEAREGWFAVVNPHREIGFALRYDAQLFSVLGFWQVWRGGVDYPWYGMNYMAALEPACDLPSLAEAARMGTALSLTPGEIMETELEATAFTAPLQVNSVGSGGDVR